MNNIKAVLFDLDGTIVNTLNDLADSTNYALKALGYSEQPTENFRYYVGNGIPVMLGRASMHEGDEAVINSLIPIFMERYRHHFIDRSEPYDGMEETLKDLKSRGIKTAVITNKANEMAQKIVEKLYPDLFDIILGSGEGIPCKPDPTGAIGVMKKLGVTADECLFVGDSGVDMQTASNLGVYSVGVLWGFRTADELSQNGAKVLIHSPEKLSEMTK